MVKISLARNAQRGFTLVELAVVLVILGLIVGGIMTGADLIKTAGLRKIITEKDRYLTAAAAFQTEYGSLPGDLPNGNDYWPSGWNGDGSGNVDQWGEFQTVFQHLRLAGLVEGNYSNADNGGQTYTAKGGATVPWVTKSVMWAFVDSRIIKTHNSNAGYGNGSMFWDNTQKHALYMISTGTPPFGPTIAQFHCCLATAVWTPEEAASIDVKIDDGKPGLGMMQVSPSTGCATGFSNITQGASATYNLAVKTQACDMAFYPGY